MNPENNHCDFSPDRRHRYTLWRVFGDAPYRVGGLRMDVDKRPVGAFLAVIGLNPSTADETKNDPTVLRCIDFARRWGFGAFCMLNLFAFRATNPQDMKLEQNPIGPENDFWLQDITRTCTDNGGIVLAAWGAHGIHMNRGRVVRAQMQAQERPLHILGLTKGGFPIHPMARGIHRVPNDAKPILWPHLE